MSYVIMDLEHTITNANHRLHLLQGEFPEQNYEDFQLQLKNDPVNVNVKFFIKALIENGSKIIILSAKKEKYKDIVIKWLKDNDIFSHEIILKEEKDYNLTDIQFKENFLKKNKKDIIFGLNDSGKECEMFHKNNIPCLRIEQK